jgi:hypothetical protein
MGDVKFGAVSVEMHTKVPEVDCTQNRGVYVNGLDWVRLKQVSASATLSHHLVDGDVARVDTCCRRHGIDEGRAHPVDIILELPERGIEGDDGLNLLVVGALKAWVAQAVDTRVTSSGRGRVQGAYISAGRRAAIEIRVAQRTIGGPPDEERVSSRLTQEAIRELCASRRVPVGASPALDGGYGLDGAVASSGTCGAVYNCSCARGGPIGSSRAWDWGSGLDGTVETSWAEEAVGYCGCSNQRAVGGHRAINRRYRLFWTVISSRAAFTVCLLMGASGGSKGTWRAVLGGGGLEGAVASCGACITIAYRRGSFCGPICARWTCCGRGGGQGTVFACGTRDALDDTECSRDGPECAL